MDNPNNSRTKEIIAGLAVLIVVVAIVAAVTKALVSRKDGSDAGVLVKVWSQLLEIIGQDPADEVRAQKP
jgi:hypothetical protein